MHTPHTHVLIVEDDDRLASLLQEYLAQHGFKLSRVATGTAGVETIHAASPDLVILDLMLPGLSGLDVCRQVRDTFSGIIMMLTASQSEADHVAGLELGADDFVVKPIEPRVLLARIRSQLRRLHGHRNGTHQTDNSGRLNIGSLQIDLSARSVRVEGHVIALTAMEFDVLLMLARNAGSVVKRDDLYTQIMGIEYDGIDRGMDVHVSRIRRKLKRAGFNTHRLKSVRGVGYLLTAQ